MIKTKIINPKKRLILLSTLSIVSIAYLGTTTISCTEKLTPEDLKLFEKMKQKGIISVINEMKGFKTLGDQKGFRAFDINKENIEEHINFKQLVKLRLINKDILDFKIHDKNNDLGEISFSILITENGITQESKVFKVTEFHNEAINVQEAKRTLDSMKISDFPLSSHFLIKDTTADRFNTLFIDIAKLKKQVKHVSLALCDIKSFPYEEYVLFKFRIWSGNATAKSKEFKISGFRISQTHRSLQEVKKEIDKLVQLEKLDKTKNKNLSKISVLNIAEYIDLSIINQIVGNNNGFSISYELVSNEREIWIGSIRFKIVISHNSEQIRSKIFKVDNFAYWNPLSDAYPIVNNYDETRIGITKYQLKANPALINVLNFRQHIELSELDNLVRPATLTCSKVITNPEKGSVSFKLYLRYKELIVESKWFTVSGFPKQKYNEDEKKVIKELNSYPAKSNLKARNISVLAIDDNNIWSYTNLHDIHRTKKLAGNFIQFEFTPQIADVPRGILRLRIIWNYKGRRFLSKEYLIEGFLTGQSAVDATLDILNKLDRKKGFGRWDGDRTDLDNVNEENILYNFASPMFRDRIDQIVNPDLVDIKKSKAEGAIRFKVAIRGNGLFKKSKEFTVLGMHTDQPITELDKYVGAINRVNKLVIKENKRGDKLENVNLENLCDYIELSPIDAIAKPTNVKLHYKFRLIRPMKAKGILTFLVIIEQNGVEMESREFDISGFYSVEEQISKIKEIINKWETNSLILNEKLNNANLNHLNERELKDYLDSNFLAQIKNKSKLTVDNLVINKEEKSLSFRFKISLENSFMFSKTFKINNLNYTN